MEEARELGRKYYLELVKADTFLSKVNWNEEATVQSATSEIHASLERARGILGRYGELRKKVLKETFPPEEVPYVEAELRKSRGFFYGLLATTLLQIGVDVSPVAEMVALLQTTQAGGLALSFISHYYKLIRPSYAHR